MIQDVKLGTHRIGTFMYAISVSVRSCSAFVWILSSKKLLFLEENHQKVGVERGVPTRRAQMVWPMMTVTVTNLRASLGSNFEKFANMWNLAIFSRMCDTKNIIHI